MNSLHKFLGNESSVSSVVGTVLMLGITVAVFGGLSLVIVEYFSEQQNELRADLAVAQSGSAYILHHRGGESLSFADGRIVLNVDGARVELPLSALAPAALGSTWDAGETLCIQGDNATGASCYYPLSVEVQSAVLVHGNAIILQDLRSGAVAPPVNPCSTDVTPPVVQIWGQVPGDVSVATIGGVAITVTLFDGCSGVNAAANPTLYYRLDDGGGPAYVSAGAMNFTAGTTWQRNIPDQGWSGQAGRTLQYYIEGQADSSGNTQANVPNNVQSDAIPAGCGSDASPPTVQTWTRSPVNVTRMTTGPITITAALTDGCWGVDTTVDPTLYYRLNNGSNPAYVSAGAMTLGSGTTWSRAIGDPTWRIQGNKTLQYYITGQRDLNGTTQANTPNDVQSEFIEAIAETTTTLCPMNAVTGTVSNCARAQSSADSDAEATLTEAGVPSDMVAVGPAKFNGTTATDIGFNSQGNALTSNDARASGNGDSTWIEVAGFDLPAGANDISALVIGFEGQKANSGSSPSVRIDYKLGAGSYITGPTFAVTNNGADVEYTRNIFSELGLWNAADVEALTVRVFMIDDQGPNLLIDHIFITVTYTETTSTVYRLDVRSSWSAVPLGGTYTVELRYRATTDTFNAQVWDGSQFTVRGTALTSSTLTTWTYALTPAEYNSGGPIVRFVDATPNGASQGSLFIEYARVVTT